ncbi:MAG: aromatic-L-amino-acid/L-tryptophan decarboxylase [Actinomycetota bacterium]|nr:aromatic-L-amino-acid/L-tryptophan decarboxylase [Actinomycetota bacterium]
MHSIGTQALDYVVNFISSRTDAPAADLDGAYQLAAKLRGAPPDEGVPFEELLGIIDAAASKAYDTAGPGYLAYIPGGGLFASAIADLLADTTNRFMNISAPAPALVQLEANVVRWLCDEFTFPADSQGILTSGGSMANFSAVVTARETYLGEDLGHGRLYVSEHVHHSITKSAHLAGLPRASVRAVPCDSNLRIRMDALHDLVRSDRDAGHKPFLVVGSAGTVNTGAVDPLSEIASFCKDENMWFHVDGAYGGFFQLCESGRKRLSGIGSADSITLDPHKGMFLPYGTGSLIVRDGSLLKAAHQEGAGYLPESSDDAHLPDFADYSPELSRDFRGLRVWLPLQLHGVNAFRHALEEKLALARRVYDALVQGPELEVPWEPDLSIVAFRPASGTEAAAEQLLDTINSSRRIFLSATSIDGQKYLRVCVLSHRTDTDRIDEAIEIIQKAATNL